MAHPGARIYKKIFQRSADAKSAPEKGPRLCAPACYSAFYLRPDTQTAAFLARPCEATAYTTKKLCELREAQQHWRADEAQSLLLRSMQLKAAGGPGRAGEPQQRETQVRLADDFAPSLQAAPAYHLL